MTPDGAAPSPPPAPGRGVATARILLGSLAAVALFSMMTLTFLDVLGRKLLSHSIVGGVELTELMMLALIFAALPLASLAGEHVVFDMIDPVLPDRVKRWQSVISNLICTGLIGVAAWFVFNRALRSHEMGDTTAQLLLPIAPFHLAVAFLMLVCALMHLYLAVSGRARA